MRLLREGDEPRVAIAAGTMVAGAMGGSEVYARRLIDGLRQRQDVAVLTIAPRGDALGQGQPHVAVRTVRSASRAGRLATLVALAASQRARRAIGGAQVVHYPFQVPDPPPPRSVPSLVTVHDVQHLDMPQFFSRAERLYRRVTYDLSAQRSDAIITISEFSRLRIINSLGIDGSAVRVIPLGHDIAPPSPLVQRDEFVLYPARRWPHKNHELLIEAVDRVRRSRPTLKLVLTAAENTDFSQLPSWCTALGSVSRQRLYELYSSAACLAFPSLYEGFGLPVLEAMAHGCPVAASNLGAIPEVGGACIEYFDPLDSADIARAIEATISSSSLYAEAGIRRAAEMTWDRCVDLHVHAYRDVARASGSTETA